MQIGLEHLIDAGLAAHVEESRSFYAARRAAAEGQPQADPATPDGLREVRRRQPVPSAPRPAVERIAEAGSGAVPVRILTPEDGAVRCAYLDLHGGGFYMGSAARNDARNASLADELGAAVVSVEYRLAPENPWPAAPDDCETAALWLLERAPSLFGTERIVIGGASAGATLVMTTLLRLRGRGLAGTIAGAVLEYGAYDLSGQSPGGRLYADEFFISAYVGHVADRTDPDISPLYGDLRGLPPALLVVGTLDLLLEDSLALAGRLTAAGGEVDLRVYPESPHGFTLHRTAMGAAASKDVRSWIAGRVAAPTPVGALQDPPSS